MITASRAQEGCAPRGPDVKRKLELLMPNSTSAEKSEKPPEVSHMFTRTHLISFGKKNRVQIFSRVGGAGEVACCPTSPPISLAGSPEGRETYPEGSNVAEVSQPLVPITRMK